LSELLAEKTMILEASVQRSKEEQSAAAQSQGQVQLPAASEEGPLSFMPSHLLSIMKELRKEMVAVLRLQGETHVEYRKGAHSLILTYDS
jgi:hypothetical protein